MPKPSHLRSVNPKPAPAAPGASVGTGGAAVEAELTPLGSPSAPPSAAPGASVGTGGAAVEAKLAPLGSPPSAALGAAVRAGGVAVETVPKPGRRRSFSASEKQRILGEVVACKKRGKRGEVEALLRREGIYSSHLTAWRKQLALRGREGLTARKSGRKPKLDAKDRRIADLEKRSARLEAKLSLAEKLIDLQKKVSAILGINLATDGES